MIPNGEIRLADPLGEVKKKTDNSNIVSNEYFSAAVQILERRDG